MTSFIVIPACKIRVIYSLDSFAVACSVVSGQFGDGSRRRKSENEMWMKLFRGSRAMALQVSALFNSSVICCFSRLEVTARNLIKPWLFDVDDVAVLGRFGTLNDQD